MPLEYIAWWNEIRYGVCRFSLPVQGFYFHITNATLAWSYCCGIRPASCRFSIGIHCAGAADHLNLCQNSHFVYWPKLRKRSNTSWPKLLVFAPGQVHNRHRGQNPSGPCWQIIISRCYPRCCRARIGKQSRRIRCTVLQNTSSHTSLLLLARASTCCCIHVCFKVFGVLCSFAGKGHNLKHRGWVGVRKKDLCFCYLW